METSLRAHSLSPCLNVPSLPVCPEWSFILSCIHRIVPSCLHAAGQAAPPRQSQKPWSNVYISTPATRPGAFKDRIKNQQVYLLLNKVQWPWKNPISHFSCSVYSKVEKLDLSISLKLQLVECETWWPWWWLWWWLFYFIPSLHSAITTTNTGYVIGYFKNVKHQGKKFKYKQTNLICT